MTPDAHPPSHSPSQHGYATLAIGVILLSIASVMSIYLSRSGLADIRTSANKTRSTESLSRAEEALEAGMIWLANGSNASNRLPWRTGEQISAGIQRVSNGRLYTASNSGTTGGTAPVHTSGTVSDGGVSWADSGVTTGWIACNDNAIPAAFRLTSNPQNLVCRPETITTNTTATEVASHTFYIATPSADPGSVLFLLANGTSADATATTTVTQGVYFNSQLFPGPPGGPPPLMGAGNIPLNGNFTVVANPNGGGTGVPVSLWSKSVVSAPQGSSITCQLGEYQSGSCSSDYLSKKDVKGVDIVDGDTTNFPPDMFQYVFGIPGSSYDLVKNNSNVIQRADCTGLDANSTGVYWITGDCTIPSNATYGQPGKPLALIVESADFRMNANSTFYGLVFAFDPAGNAGSMTMNGGATFHGSLLSNDTVSMGININGTFNLLWNKEVMDALTNEDNSFLKLMARIPGSWSDYLN